MATTYANFWDNKWDHSHLYNLIFCVECLWHKNFLLFSWCEARSPLRRFDTNFHRSSYGGQSEQITNYGHQKQNGCQITKLIITHSIFNLEAPDFAW